MNRERSIQAKNTRTRQIYDQVSAYDHGEREERERRERERKSDRAIGRCMIYIASILSIMTMTLTMHRTITAIV